MVLCIYGRPVQFIVLHFITTYTIIFEGRLQILRRHIVLLMSTFTVWQLIEVLYCGIVCKDKSSICGTRCGSMWWLGVAFKSIF